MGGALQRTPFYQEHVRHQAKLVEFNGWEMPVQYATGILREHEIVRTAAGLFDVSHMGRFEIRGPGAVPFVSWVITNDLEKASEQQLLYSAVCAPDGGILDDVTVYRLPDRVLVVANAGNLVRIREWFERQIVAWKGPGATFRDRSGELAQIAFQGPKTEAILAPLVEGDLTALGYYRHLTARTAGIGEVLISRNGYTGEDGFEIYLPAEHGPRLWRALIDAGAAHGVAPIGLGARDTLRLEMCYALYGNELSTETTPLEAGLGWIVKLKKDDFIGKEALVAQKAAGLKSVLAGFEIEGNRYARHGQPIHAGGREVGVVTSGGFLPSVKKGMGLGYVPPELATAGSEIAIDVRGTMVAARVVDRPFWKHGSHK